MAAFLRLVRLSMQQQLTYRAAALGGLATNLVFGLFRAAVILALYAGRAEVNGLSLSAALTFTAVSQALITFLSQFGSFELISSVIDGSISADLLRPIRLTRLWMGRDLGRSLVNLVLRGFTLLAIFPLFYPLSFENSLAGWLLTALSLALGWLLGFYWRFLINLSAFWTPDARGIARGAFAFSMLVSGFIFPLRLFPDGFARLCQFTPFPAMFTYPVEALLAALILWLALRFFHFGLSHYQGTGS